MESKLHSILDIINSTIRVQIITTICQTLLYGIYLFLVPIAVSAIITNGLQTRARKWLLAITTSMFALTTCYWIVSVVSMFLQVDISNNILTTCYGSDNAPSCIVQEAHLELIPPQTWLVMFDDILLVNYIVADGIVVWRAWVLCSDQSRVVLMIPVVMLGINTIIYLTAIAARAIQIQMLLGSKPQMHPIHFNLSNLINVTQGAHLIFSVLINIFATSVVALKAWKYRKLLIESGIGLRTPRQAIRILAILVESGTIYILIGVMSVVSFSILAGLQMPLGALFMIVGEQLVGLYPVIVILLVEKNRWLNSTYNSFGTIIDARGDRPSHVEPMAFAARSVLASLGETDLVTKPPHSTIHITSDHILELGGAGMGAGNDKASNEGHAASY